MSTIQQVNKVERVADGRNLLDNLGRIVLSTWETAPQVFEAQLRGEDAIWTVTNNMPIYRIKDGEPMIGVVGPKGNLFADERYQKQAYEGIVGTEFFQPKEGC